MSGTSSSTGWQSEDIRLLIARLDDLCHRAERGEAALSPFLTPREAKYAASHLSARLRAGTALLWGGFGEAERARAVILPDYTEGLTDPELLASDPIQALSNAGLEELAETLRGAVCAVRIQGSGYRELSHRDYLGSVLGLGLERDAIGDILIPDPHNAYMVTSALTADFLMTGLEKVATDTVRVTPLPAGLVLRDYRRLTPINDTVASPRLDCVVAALCNLSREKAQTAVKAGLVELDYELCEACDRTVEAPAVVTVRGYGKFAVKEIDGVTRKGRIRLVGGKYA